MKEPNDEKLQGSLCVVVSTEYQQGLTKRDEENNTKQGYNC